MPSCRYAVIAHCRCAVVPSVRKAPPKTEHPPRSGYPVSELVGQVEAPQIGTGGPGGADAKPESDISAFPRQLVRVPRSAVVHERRGADADHVEDFVHEEDPVLKRSPKQPGPVKGV